MLNPARAPWLPPGVVVHPPLSPVDDLLFDFAQTLRERGFTVQGYVQINNARGSDLGMGCADRVELLDLATDDVTVIDRGDGCSGKAAAAMALHRLQAAMRDTPDLLIISRFQAFDKAKQGLRGTLAEGTEAGIPVLTSIAGRCQEKSRETIGSAATLLAADPAALWQWWGPDRLYADLMQGVAEDEVRDIVVGPRWIMVEGPHGTGLAYLPRHPHTLLPRLATFRQASLRDLARLCLSWDPVEMAVAGAAINAHYNRYDLEACLGTGVGALRTVPGRAVAVGSFPGMGETLGHAKVIETDPRQGEYPTIAMDSLLPGASVVVGTSSLLVKRILPRVLRLAGQARVALVGPFTPLSPRLHSYGVEVLGGLIVRDVAGLAAAVREGASQRALAMFGRYVHLREGGMRPD